MAAAHETPAPLGISPHWFPKAMSAEVPTRSVRPSRVVRAGLPSQKWASARAASASAIPAA